MAPGLLPPLLWFVPHRDPLSPTLQAILFGLGVALGAHVYWRYQHIRRPEDTERAAAVLGYALSVLGMLAAFPGQPQLGLAVLAVLAFGDGSATLGGKLLGGPTLPWNREKTWSGLACFLLFGTLTAATFYWGEPWFNPEALEHRHVGFDTSLLCAAFATSAAALAESVRSRVNDNVRVGFVAAVAVTLAHAVLVGW
jgi:dolichol kinase